MMVDRCQTTKTESAEKRDRPAQNAPKKMRARRIRRHPPL